MSGPALENGGSKLQQRGHCQCCGREQAVLASGRMALHGYTVEQGWFEGTCEGSKHGPIQRDSKVAEQVIADIRAAISKMKLRVDSLHRGDATLDMVENHDRTPGAQPLVPFSTLDVHDQRRAVEDAISRIRHRMNSGNAFASHLSMVIQQFHGQPLREVTARAEPPAILQGECRKASNGGTLTATYVHRGRVWWQDQAGRKGAMMIRAWRALTLA